jgi:hypothetical protein
MIWISTHSSSLLHCFDLNFSSNVALLRASLELQIISRCGVIVDQIIFCKATPVQNESMLFAPNDGSGKSPIFPSREKFWWSLNIILLEVGDLGAARCTPAILQQASPRPDVGNWRGIPSGRSFHKIDSFVKDSIGHCLESASSSQIRQTSK